MNHVNVMALIHGSGMSNAYFLRPHRSVIEIIPYGFGDEEGGWAGRYGREVHHLDDEVSLED